MSEQFDRDIAQAKRDIGDARAALLDALGSLNDSDLGREARPGSTVGQTLEHVIHSEVLYARLAYHLRDIDQVAEEPLTKHPDSVADAVHALEESRTSLVAAIEGVDEETFYKPHIVGREEQTVLGLLEQVAEHDRAHAAQIKSLIEDES
jgi:uncharacterized damage-inducible protein DinB